MKTPQKENGYTAIANEIMEALACTNLSSYQSRILFFIFRKTYGFNKKEDWLANSQIVTGTGIKKSHVSRTIKQLIERRIVTKTGNKIAFNKSHTEWRELPKEVTKKKSKIVTNSGNTVTNSGNSELPVQGNTKETITKVDNTKESIVPPKKIFEEEKNITPADEMRSAVSAFEEWMSVGNLSGILHEMKQGLINNHHPPNYIDDQIKGFMLYWTEPTKSGKKQKWETEKTFEIKRRFAKWISNDIKWNKQKLTREEENLKNAHIFF